MLRNPKHRFFLNPIVRFVTDCEAPLLLFELPRFSELEAKRELRLPRITDTQAEEAVEVEERGS